jgi:DNA replication protein DnaD
MAKKKLTPAEEKQLHREYVQRWRQLGPMLEKIRRQELREFRHEDNIEIIDALFDLGTRQGTQRTTSGLVELQRILAKGRR